LRAAAFDELAGDYDADFTHSPVGSALRAIVAGRFEEAFAGAQRVLDLGSGTGEDAIRVARGGASVLGIDASAAMVRAAQEKARRGGCADRAQFRCLPIESLGGADTGGLFDGVLSNFGALNCVADLPAVASAVAAKLTPGARLVWVLMGRHVPWEWAWFLLRADLSRASRRLRGITGWRGLNIAYPTPAAVIGMLTPYFRVDALRPLGVVLPPSYAAAGLGRRPRLLAALTRLERSLQNRRALAYCADHYIIEATRLPVPAATAESRPQRSA
jgi:SAM-dependent methyltransferase